MSAHFTATRFALWLGLSKRAVLLVLEGIPPTSRNIVRGQSAFAWSISAVPVQLRSELNGLSEKLGYRDAEAMLNDLPKALPAAVPLAEVSEQSLDRAAQRQRALLPSLRRETDPNMSAADFEQLGIADYKKEFGHTITGRHLRNLLQRVRDRDGGAQNLDRLELFLDARPARKIETTAEKCGAEFFPLQKVISGFKNPAQLTTAQTDLIFQKSCELYDELVAEGRKPKKARLALLKFLQANAPFLATSPNALRVTWARKMERYLERNGSANALLHAPNIISKSERAKLDESEYAFAVYLAGRLENINLAYLQWLESDLLRPETKERFSFQCAGIPQAPRAWREAVKHDAAIYAIELRGTRNADMRGAFFSRDPDSFASGDYDQSDDLTLPIIWWDDLPDAEIFCGQGQFIPWMDERSWMIYNANLIPDKAYSGFSLRNSWTDKADTWGLPRKALYIERGIWYDSKVFAGSRSVVGTEETEMGIRRLGLKFQHAKYPRGKLIERYFGSFQDLMHREPGYAGRNQMMDKFEAIQKQLRLVRSGKEHPSKFFLSKSQLMERLLYFIDKLNTTPKGGKYHLNRTPKQVYEDCFTTKLVKIPDTHRHYLASNKIETSVTGNGITFKFGQRTFNYKNYRTGQLRGQRITAWFNPENPSLLAVTKLDGSDPFVVRRSTMIPAHDAPTEKPEIWAKAVSENAAQNAYGKELRRSLKPFFDKDFMDRMFRPVIADDSSMELGRVITEGQAEVKKENQLKANARKAFSKLGARMPSRPSQEKTEAAAELVEWLNQKDAE